MTNIRDELADRSEDQLRAILRANGKEVDDKATREDLIKQVSEISTEELPPEAATSDPETATEPAAEKEPKEEK